MKGDRTTLKDLAQELGLSPSTISRALNNHSAISDSTKKLVQKKAKQIGFIPNSMASSFRKKKSGSIGVIVPRIDIHFHSLVISGIEELAYKSGYNVTIFQSNNSLKREKEIAKLLETKMVEGVIVCLAIDTKKYDHFERFNKLGIPLVFYDRVPSNFDSNKVVIDDFKSSFNATEHLIEMGCKNIFHIAGNQSTSIFRSRLEGYQKAIEEHNIKIAPNSILITKNLTYKEGVKKAKKILTLSKLPDGIFCANDYTAVGAIQVFIKAGIKIPEQVAIVGFSNYPISRVIEPNLTTIDDQAFKMGTSSAQLLFRLIDDSDYLVKTENISLKTELIVRESSMRKTINQPK